MERELLDVVFDNGVSVDLGGGGPVRPRGGDGVGEGVNRSAAFVIEGSARDFGWEVELDVEMELDEEDVDSVGGWGMGMTGAVFGGGVGPDRIGT